jgi:menaquinone-dependent protoporphyrinogen oxidase
MKILVQYESKHGSTREIAEKIGRVLEGAGLSAAVSPCGLAADPSSYDAVVVGSAVYFGCWRRKAVAFLEAWTELPSAPPLWLFFSGPTGKGDPSVQAMNGKGIPDRRLPLIRRIKPQDIAFFHGKLEEAGLNPLERWAIRNVHAPIGDFRDWEAISRWAEGIADGISGHTASERKA